MIKYPDRVRDSWVTSVGLTVHGSRNYCEVVTRDLR